MYTSHRCERRDFSGIVRSRHRIPIGDKISRDCGIYNEIIRELIRKIRRAAMEMKLDLSGRTITARLILVDGRQKLYSQNVVPICENKLKLLFFC
mgnify:FL=1